MNCKQENHLHFLKTTSLVKGLLMLLCMVRKEKKNFWEHLQKECIFQEFCMNWRGNCQIFSLHDILWHCPKRRLLVEEWLIATLDSQSYFLLSLFLVLPTKCDRMDCEGLITLVAVYILGGNIFCTQNLHFPCEWPLWGAKSVIGVQISEIILVIMQLITWNVKINRNINTHVHISCQLNFFC